MLRNTPVTNHMRTEAPTPPPPLPPQKKSDMRTDVPKTENSI